MEVSTKTQFSALDGVVLGKYRFDPASGELSCGSRGVKLTPKGAHILTLLAHTPGRLVSHEEIQNAVWPQGFMHEGNLAQHVYLLRRAFAQDPRVRIENVPCRGYRLTVVPASKRQPVQLVAAALLGAVLIMAALAFAGLANASRRLPEAANETYRTALYHLARPAEHPLAEVYFERTIRLAPNAPEGYAGIAILDAMRASHGPNRVRRCSNGELAASRSLRLEDTALGHTAQALLAYWCDRSEHTARSEITIALTQGGTDPLVLNFAARLALWTGDFPRAVAYSRRAVELEPDSPETLSTLGLSQYYAGEFGAGARSFKQALEIMPDSPPLRTFLAESTSAQRRH